MRKLPISYTNMCGGFTVCGVGGCEFSFCVGERGVYWGCFGDCVNHSCLLTAMSISGLHFDMYLVLSP